jgi:hypothetical protein
MGRITKKLTCVDDFDTSDKYPTWGFSISFKDETGDTYFVEYPNSKNLSNINYKKGFTYEVSFRSTLLKNFIESEGKRFKMTHLKNINNNI